DKGGFEYLLQLGHRYELNLVFYVLVDIVKIFEVVLRKNDSPYTSASRRQYLFLDTSHRQDKSGQGDFAGHGCITAHLAVTEQGYQRTCHGHSGRRAVFRNGTGRNM